MIPQCRPRARAIHAGQLGQPGNGAIGKQMFPKKRDSLIDRLQKTARLGLERQGDVLAGARFQVGGRRTVLHGAR